MYAHMTEAQKATELERLAKAMRDTSAEGVIETFTHMLATNGGGNDLETLFHAIVVEVGKTNEKLGGHCVVSKRDVLEQLMPKRRA